MSGASKSLLQKTNKPSRLAKKSCRCAASAANTSYLNPTHPDNPVPEDVTQKLARHARYTLATYARPPLVFMRGKGCKIWDSQEREYLDMTAGIAVNALGHSDAGVARVIAQQAEILMHGSNLFHNNWAGELAELLVESTIVAGGLGFPGPGQSSTAVPHYNAEASTSSLAETGTDHTEGPSSKSSGLKVFFANSGTEANEGALKFARKFGKTKADKYQVICFQNAFHGRTFGALSATMQAKYQQPFAPLVPGFVAGILNDIEGATRLITDRTCGVIVEPIQGEGGIMEANEAFLRALRKRCDEVGAALIFDEIQCGLGRTGTLWAHSSLPVDCHPDIITMAKPLANGIPIGAIMMRDRIADVIKLGDHGTTFGGGALQTRVAHHVLTRILSPGFMDHLRRSAVRLDARLSSLPELFPDSVVAPPRGRGLIRGLPMKNDALAGRVQALCRERGVLVLTCGNATIRFVPSLVVTEQEIGKTCDVLESALSIVQGES